MVGNKSGKKQEKHTKWKWNNFVNHTNDSCDICWLMEFNLKTKMISEKKTFDKRLSHKKKCQIYAGFWVQFQYGYRTQSNNQIDINIVQCEMNSEPLKMYIRIDSSNVSMYDSIIIICKNFEHKRSITCALVLCENFNSVTVLWKCK